jgi:hypothetical protein
METGINTLPKSSLINTRSTIFEGLMKWLVIISFLCTVLVHSSCRKESRLITATDASVYLSADTLKYDTVFTTAGSITQFFKIFNNNNGRLKLSTVKLMGGPASFYKMNVDGLPGTQFNDLEIAANDSLYVFVSVNINPNAANLPFLVQDSVLVSYNGNNRFVQLQAYGQNAIFLRNQKITGNVSWNNQLPYVIIGGIRVDTTATLTIQKGTRIYLHADAPFIVDGTLICTGEQYDSTRVVFRGDRLDEPYRDYPAAWPGILFRGQSKNNILQYTTIKNAYQGLIADGPSINTSPKLVLRECVVDNAYDAGILGINSSIQARNCLISNCGNNIGFVLGGNYSFIHCTAASFSNLFILHKNPVLAATNYLKQANNAFITADLTANFTNCIFWGQFGTVEDEVVAEKIGTGGVFNVSLTNCLYKLNNPLSTLVTSTNGLLNQTPLFDSVNTSARFYRFQLKTGSPAINKGVPTGITNDLDGKPRPVGLPDLGSYEKQ